MANFNVPVDANYSTLTGIVNGDSITLQNFAKLTVDTTTVILSTISCSSIIRTIEVLNTSTTTPIFFRHNGAFTLQGTFDIQGDYITLGTSDGTASQSFTVPTDASGNKYAHIGYCLVGDDLYAQVDAFTDLFSDRRGRVFVYDQGSNTITFGDGTNGSIPPNLDAIKISNIEIQSNNATINTFGSTISADKCLFSDFDLNNVSNIDFGVVGIHNLNRQLALNDFYENNIDRLVITGDVGNRTRVKLGKGASKYNEIFIASQNNTSGDTILVDSLFTYQIGTLTFLSLAPQASAFGASSACSLSLNNGTIDTLYSFNGNDDYCFQANDGINGVIDQYYFATRTKRTQAMARGHILGNGNSSGMTINNATYYGTETQGTVHRGITGFSVTNFSVKNYESAPTSVFTRFAEVNSGQFGAGALGFTIQDAIIRGQITDTSNVIVVGGEGSNLRNIYFTDELNVSLSIGRNTEVENVYVVGNAPSVYSGVTSISTRSNLAGDEGYICQYPNTPTSRILTGVASDIKDSGGNFYSETGLKIATETKVLFGIETFVGVSVDGSNTGNWTVQYDMKGLDGAYSGTFQTLNATNLEASRLAIPGYTQGDPLILDITYDKVSGDLTNYIQRLIIECTFDPLVEWTEPPADTNISITGLVAGSNVALLDSNDNLYENNTVAGTSTTININQYLYDPSVGYRVRIRKPGFEPLEFDFTDVGAVSLPVSQVEVLDIFGLAVYGRGDGTTTSLISIDYTDKRIDIGDGEATAEDTFDLVSDESITDSAMVLSVALKFDGTDGFLNRWGAGAGENWLFRRLAPGDTNSAQNANYTRADDPTLSPDDEVNGSVDFRTRNVRNGVDTQIVVDAINALGVDLKGADNRDLTEVYNNTPSIDVNAVATAVDVQLSADDSEFTGKHGLGLYNRVGGGGGYAGPSLDQIKRLFKESTGEIDKTYKELLEKIKKEQQETLQDMLNKGDKQEILEFMKIVELKTDISKEKISDLLKEIKKQTPKKATKKVEKKQDIKEIEKVWEDMQVEELWEELQVDLLWKDIKGK